MVVGAVIPIPTFPVVPLTEKYGWLSLELLNIVKLFADAKDKTKSKTIPKITIIFLFIIFL
jgi:hypothetical protein